MKNIQNSKRKTNFTNSILNDQMKLLPFFLLLQIVTFAQLSDTTINGKKYLIYPIQQEISGRSTFVLRDYCIKEEVIQRDEISGKIISRTIKNISYPNEYGLDEPEKMNEIMDKKMQISSGLFLRTENWFIHDTLAICKDKLPDGDYVMFFKDFPYVENKTLRYKQNVVASFFSIKDNYFNGEAMIYDTNGELRKKGNYLNGKKEGKWIVYHKKIHPDKTLEANKGIDINDIQTWEQYQNYKRVYFYNEDFFSYKQDVLHGEKGIITNGMLQMSNSYCDGILCGKQIWNDNLLYLDQNIDEGNYYVCSEDKLVNTSLKIINDAVLPGKSIIVRASNLPDDFMEIHEIENGQGEMEYQGRYFDIGFDLNHFLFVKKENTVLTSNFEDTNVFINYNNYYFSEANNILPWDKMISQKGYYCQYQSFEEHYANGQLKVKFELVNGSILKEPIIYYPNGNVQSTVDFDTENQQFSVKFYNFSGEQVLEKRYNQKGELIVK
jgi:antitoxin component YwqK of YwqJK toxin-antitoxin module